MTKAKGKLSNLANTLSAAQNILREAQESLEEESMRQLEEKIRAFQEKFQENQQAMYKPIRLDQIVDSYALHHPCPLMEDLGYGFLNAFPGSDKPPLVNCGDLERLLNKFDAMNSKILQLANSLYEYGMFSPIVVSEIGMLSPMVVSDSYDAANPKYKVILGQKRILASVLNAMRKNYSKSAVSIPGCVVGDNKLSALCMILSENHGRLDPITEATYCDTIRNECNVNISDIAERTGIDRRIIRQRLQLLKLPRGLHELIKNGKMSISRGLSIVKSLNPNGLS
jgi:ParB/RepB/Spo0J family partition protein